VNEQPERAEVAQACIRGEAWEIHVRRQGIQGRCPVTCTPDHPGELSEELRGSREGPGVKGRGVPSVQENEGVAKARGIVCPRGGEERSRSRLGKNVPKKRILSGSVDMGTNLMSGRCALVIGSWTLPV